MMGLGNLKHKKMTDSFKCFQSCLAEFENNWETPKAVSCLEEALEIYIDLENERDDRFDNLIRRYGRSLEKKAKELFNSSEVESDQYIGVDFLKIITKELHLFIQFQSIEEVFGRSIKELILLLIARRLNVFEDSEEVAPLDETRQSIHGLSDRQLDAAIDALQKFSR